MDEKIIITVTVERSGDDVTTNINGSCDKNVSIPMALASAFIKHKLTEVLDEIDMADSAELSQFISQFFQLRESPGLIK